MRYLVLMFVVTLLESTVGARLALGGIRPDFGLALVVYGGLFGGWRSGTLLGFCYGLLRGCLEPAWLGLDSLLLTAVGFAAASTSPVVNRSHPLVQGMLIAVLLLTYDLLRALVITSAVLTAALPLWLSNSPAAALYTGLLVPAAVALLPRILFGGARRAVS